MGKECWIEKLPGMPRLPSCQKGYARPDRATSTYIEEGHFVEYFEYPFDRDRTVVLFYGPGEFIIPTHPGYSIIRPLDRCCVVDFSYGDIFRTLRNFPESRLPYRKMKEAYQQKIAQRLTLAGLACPWERLEYLKESQPWVLRVAPDRLVAGYLRVSVDMLKEMKRG